MRHKIDITEQLLGTYRDKLHYIFPGDTDYEDCKMIKESLEITIALWKLQLYGMGS